MFNTSQNWWHHLSFISFCQDLWLVLVSISYHIWNYGFLDEGKGGRRCITLPLPTIFVKRALHMKDLIWKFQKYIVQTSSFYNKTFYFSKNVPVRTFDRLGLIQWLSGTQHITFRKIVFQLWSDAIIILNYEKFNEREAYPEQKFEQNEIDLV